MSLPLFSEGNLGPALAFSLRQEKSVQAQPKIVLVDNNDYLSQSASHAAPSDFYQRFVFHGNPALEQLASISSLLMLQWPISRLLSRIAAWIRIMGHQVRRVKLNLQEYIKRAGGYTQNADSARILIAHKDGSFTEADQEESFFKLRAKPPKVKAGDEILVLPKLDVKSRQIWKDMPQIIFFRLR